MKKYFIITATALSVALFLPSLWEGRGWAQNVGINSTGAAPNASALLDIDGTTGGLLIPRLTDAQATTLAATAAEGLMIYNTTTKCFQIFIGTAWQNIYCGCTAAPAAPTATAATSVTATSFNANWSASPGATTYYLDVDDNSDFSSPLAGYNNQNVGNVLIYPVTGLTACTIYYYRVRANNSCGTSANSNTITVVSCVTDDSYTVLKLHMNGTNGSTTFTDNSPVTPHTVTANNGAQISDVQAKFCQSGLFDGINDYLSIPDDDDWTWGTNYSVDFWVNPTNFTGGADQGINLISHAMENPNDFWRIFLGRDGACCARKIYLDIYQGTPLVNIGSSVTLTALQWYHIAIVKEGNNYYMFINGQLVGSATTATAMNNNSGTLRIGDDMNGTGPLNGYLDELRISKGIARWTSNFTPPANPYCD